MDQRNPLRSVSGRRLVCGETCFSLEDELLSLGGKKRRINAWNSPMLALKSRNIFFLRCLTRFIGVGPVSVLFLVGAGGPSECHWKWPGDKVRPVLQSWGLMMSHRGVSSCNQLLLKTVQSLTMLRPPYNAPMVNIYIYYNIYI